MKHKALVATVLLAALSGFAKTFDVDISTGRPATTNSYFRVAASDGTELFSIEKTDSYLVGVNATGITKSGNTVTIPVNVVAPSHPYIRAPTHLLVNSFNKASPVQLVYDPTTNLLVADF